VSLRPMNPSAVPSNSVSLAELLCAILRFPILGGIGWSEVIIVLLVLYCVSTADKSNSRKRSEFLRHFCW
jgi:hypothetical protein